MPASLVSRKHWVFDLDGTLTLPVHDFEAIRIALDVPVGVDVLSHLAALPPAEAAALRARLNSIEYELATRTAPAPGVASLLRRLSSRGSRLGILTRNTSEIALKTLRHVGIADLFPPDSIVGRDDAPPKPDPAGLHLFAERWAVPAEQLVMLGDYVYDLMTGRAAGATTVHVDPDRAFRWPHLMDIGVGSLEEIAAHLEE